MCVKIVNNSCEIPYDLSKPLEEQIAGCEQIIINYEPSDKAVDVILSEVKRIAKNGISASLKIKVIHNNNLTGFKVKQSIKQAMNDIKLNELIKLMVLSHKNLDSKLEELSNTFNGTNDEQQKT